MVGLASLAAIARVVVQWSCRVLVLLLVGALLAEASPQSASGARPANDGAAGDSQNSSAGKRCDLPCVVCAAYAERMTLIPLLGGVGAHGARCAVSCPSVWNRFASNITVKSG